MIILLLSYLTSQLFQDISQRYSGSSGRSRLSDKLQQEEAEGEGGAAEKKLSIYACKYLSLHKFAWTHLRKSFCNAFYLYMTSKWKFFFCCARILDPFEVVKKAALASRMLPAHGLINRQ